MLLNKGFDRWHLIPAVPGGAPTVTERRHDKTIAYGLGRPEICLTLLSRETFASKLNFHAVPLACANVEDLVERLTQPFDLLSDLLCSQRAGHFSTFRFHVMQWSSVNTLVSTSFFQKIDCRTVTRRPSHASGAIEQLIPN